MLNTPARESLAHSATIYIPPGARAAGGAPEWGEHALHASAHHGAASGASTPCMQVLTTAPCSPQARGSASL